MSSPRIVIDSVSEAELKNQPPENVGVGKDNDGYITSMSLETCLSIPTEANKILNSKTDAGDEEMRTAAISLMVFLYQKNPNSIKNLDCAELNHINFHDRNLNMYDLKEVMKKCVNNNFNTKNFGTGKAYDLFLAFKLNTPRKNQEPLSPQWEAVTKKYNLPKQFAMNYRDTAKEEGNIMGFRLDEKINRLVKRPSACKPGYILFKVSNWGPMKDRIAEDQVHFGKTDAMGQVIPGTQTKQTEHPEHYKSIIDKQPMYYTLQEMLAGVESRKYLVDEKLSTNDRICFATVPGVDNNPRDKNIYFSFTMNTDYSKLIAETIYAKIPNNERFQESLNKNIGLKWNNNWGTIENALKREYKLQSDASGTGNEFKDVNEIVIPVNKNLRSSHVFNHVQHSFECYNPGIQSNVDTPAIFVDQTGTPSIKNDFKSHINFLENFSNAQVMHINRHWNMNIKNGAGQLVIDQIAIASQYNSPNKNQIPIDPSTLVAFVKNLEKEKYVLTETNFQQLKDVVINLSQDGVEARVQTCNYLTWQINENGQLPYKRDLINGLISSIKADATREFVEGSNPAIKAMEYLILASEKLRDRQSEQVSSVNNSQSSEEKGPSQEQEHTPERHRFGGL